jgi:iron(III) transport system permease protein
MILTLSLYPYVYLAARTAFIEQSVTAVEVSRSLGRGPWQSFFTVALPLARPAVFAGLALVLMETLADFGAVDYCAVDTLATGIYRTWKGQESQAAAAQLSSVLLGGVFLLVLLETLSRRKARFHAATTRQRAPAVYPLGPVRGGLALIACLVPILLGFGGPLAIFATMAWQAGDARAAELFFDHGANTFLLALIASVLAATLAVLVAYGRRVWPGKVMTVALKLSGLGYALPGFVVAIGLLVPLTWLDWQINGLVGDWFGRDARPGLILSGSVVAVVLGYQTRFLAVALAMIEQGLARVRLNLDDAARTLGASGRRLLWSVHLPMLRGSLLAAMLLVFVDVTKELPATLMLRPFDFDTLAVRVYQLASDERLSEASSGALAIMVIGLLPVIVLSSLLDRRPREPVREPVREPAAEPVVGPVVRQSADGLAS